MRRTPIGRAAPRLAILALLLASGCSRDSADVAPPAPAGPAVKAADVENFYDLAETKLVLTPDAERQYRDTDVRVRTRLGERAAVVVIPLAGYQDLQLDRDSYTLDLSVIGRALARVDHDEFVWADDSLQRVLDEAEFNLHGDIVAYGFLDQDGVEFAVGFAYDTQDPKKKKPRFKNDAWDECNGVVWGDDDCNNGKCETLVEAANGKAKLFPGECEFHDVDWNPWNYCFCRDDLASILIWLWDNRQ